MDQTEQVPDKRSLVGEALVKEGVITEEQLARAMRIQQLLEQPRQLREVLLELGFATKKAITDAVNKHGSGMRLGDMLVEQGLVSMDALESALTMQKERGLKLGEALIELGAINERTLLQSLATQARVPFIEPMFGMIEQSVLSGVSPDYLARYQFIPFSRSEDGRVRVVVNDLHEQNCLQAIQEFYRDDFALALGPKEAIRQCIEDFRRFRTERPREGQGRVEQAGDSIVQLVNHIIATAVDERASDIHIEPMSDKIRIRYRIDGVLVYRTDLPLDLLPRIISRIKVLSEVNITEHQRHQGGRFLYSVGVKEFDLRLSIYVTVHGECAVIRILNKQTGLMELDELGMNRAMKERYRVDVLDMPTGVVLITGPTGSGKTTTLYSSLAYSNKIDMKIITAEDPVEYMIDGLIQCSINDKIGRTFEGTLREIVRQDPDIIVLGEIRDRTSAETAIQAALTGHKVYSTFHTEDTIGGLLRLIDMDIETFLISSTVISVVAQRLLRRVCSQCAAPAVPLPRELDRLALSLEDVHDFEFKKGQGCKLCNYTGYHGRVGAYELLVLNEDVKEAILAKRPAHIIRRISTETTGLISMREDAIAKTVRGFTTFDEVLRHTPRTFETRSLKQILAMTQ
ncbi:MAG: Flp pilus assembly complex ATPase component TadA [Candidatus Hydrogenedentes bacterium]|nr:Flp pilus assembly complex ATPase component TadA [Candidatus Hydrogenedentota bacterium]